MNKLLYQALTAFLEDNIISVILAILFIAPFITWRVAWNIRGWKSETDNELKQLNKQVDGLRKFMFSTFGRPIDVSTSPIALSEYGKELSQGVDAPSLATRYAERLKGNVGDKNAYQIQELCFEYAKTKILKDIEAHDAERFNTLTTYAFEEGIDTDKIMRVIGILMRDILLKHTGLSPKSIDDHTPPTSDR